MGLSWAMNGHRGHRGHPWKVDCAEKPPVFGTQNVRRWSLPCQAFWSLRAKILSSHWSYWQLCVNTSQYELLRPDFIIAKGAKHRGQHRGQTKRWKLTASYGPDFRHAVLQVLLNCCNQPCRFLVVLHRYNRPGKLNSQMSWHVSNLLELSVQFRLYLLSFGLTPIDPGALPPAKHLVFCSYQYVSGRERIHNHPAWLRESILALPLSVLPLILPGYYW